MKKISIILLFFLCSSLAAHEFTFIIPMYNNARWVAQCLDSIARQEGVNAAGGIIIDDASNDDTELVVKNYLAASSLKNRFIYLKNKRRMGVAYNRYTAAHLSSDDSILIMLDGDDELEGCNVLKTLRRVYADDAVWVAHSKYRLKSTGKSGSFCKPLSRDILENGSVRKQPWSTSHLRSCRAWLFKQIPEHYFKMNGVWLPSCTDFAMMFALIELAGNRVKFIDEFLCRYNDVSSLNIFRDMRRKREVFLTEQFVRRMHPLKRLAQRPASQKRACST